MAALEDWYEQASSQRVEKEVIIPDMFSYCPT